MFLYSASPHIQSPSANGSIDVPPATVGATSGSESDIIWRVFRFPNHFNSREHTTFRTRQHIRRGFFNRFGAHKMGAKRIKLLKVNNQSLRGQQIVIFRPLQRKLLGFKSMIERRKVIWQTLFASGKRFTQFVDCQSYGQWRLYILDRNKTIKIVFN